MPNNTKQEELKRKVRRVFNSRLTTQINFKVIVPKSQQHYRTIVAPYNPTEEKIVSLINSQVQEAITKIKSHKATAGVIQDNGLRLDVDYVPLSAIEAIEKEYK